MKKVIFSEVKGVVLDDGKPVSGATVERCAKESDKEYTETAITDSHGNFFFKTLEKTSIPKLFHRETVITQRLIVTIGNNKYKLWVFIKRNYDNNGELEGKAINLLCDIKNEYVDNGGKFMGIGRLHSETGRPS